MLSKLRTLTGTFTGTAAAAALALGLVGCANPQGSVSTHADDSAIIGGKEATGTGDFAKTIVALYNVEAGFICTGSLISDDMVLTAAHCVVGDAAATLVIFDKNAIQTVSSVLKPIADANGSLDDIPATAAIRRAVSYRVTPIWPIKQNDLLNTGDMAVLKFKGGLVKGFVPAELLPKSITLENGQAVTLSGYGTSDGIKGEGSGLLRFVETTIQKADYTSTEILIEQSLGKGACHGDSGGPAYVTVEGKRYVIGVTSRGVNDPGDTCGISAAYTGVSFYNGWLEKTVAALRAEKIEEKVPQLPSTPEDTPKENAKKNAEENPAQSIADAS